MSGAAGCRKAGFPEGAGAWSIFCIFGGRGGARGISWFCVGFVWFCARSARLVAPVRGAAGAELAARAVAQARRAAVAQNHARDAISRADGHRRPPCTRACRFVLARWAPPMSH